MLPLIAPMLGRLNPPSKTVFREWPDAWYYLRAGNQFTNHDIYRWAVQPLPGEDIKLVVAFLVMLFSSLYLGGTIAEPVRRLAAGGGL